MSANVGDSVAVPRMVFTRLTATGADDARFRVALYMVASGEADALAVAKDLHLTQGQAEKALEYWEGAGLLECTAEPLQHSFTPASRRRLTSHEVAAAGEQDAMLPGLVGEIQRIFGGVVSQSDINIFATLYSTDGIPADMILLAASYFAGKGKANARYIEKTLLAWRRDGISDCAAADAYLKRLAQREQREAEVAAMMGKNPAGFTAAERRHIACWQEEYGYGDDMLESARLAAGEKRDDVRYLNGILKKWYAKGYTSPKDIQQQGGNHNIRVHSERGNIAPEDDLLANFSYTPMQGVGK